MAHPISTATVAIDAALKSVVDINPTFMQTADKAAALRDLARLESRLAELRLRIMACSSDVADSTAARDVAGWYAAETRSRFEESRRDEWLARVLDRDYGALARGIREGEITIAQAQTIARALAALPTETGADLVEKAEQALVAEAARFGPPQLARLGRRILDVIAPEIADEAEARRLRELESNGRRRSRLTLRRQGDGTTRISGLRPDAAASRLATYLEAFASPRNAVTREVAGRKPPDPVARLSYPRRLGEAFTQLLETMDTGRLPLHGGDATTVIVTISLDALRRELSSAELIGVPAVSGESETSEALTAGEVRRLACNAQVIPAVLGGDGEILDLGRRQRLFSAAQRRALLLQDRQCRAVGCDIPGTWTEAHHWVPWDSGGGYSDLSNGVLLCSYHHHRAHDDGYSAERLSNGDVRFHRRR